MQTRNIFATIPPDGGWGWVVVAASFLVMLLHRCVTHNFSVLYAYLVNSFDTSYAVIAGMHTMTTVAMQCTNISCSPFIKKYGCRPVAVFGALFLCAGSISLAFVESLPLMYLAFGVNGIGIGCLHLTALVVVQQYFDKKRPFAAALSTMGGTLSVLLYSPWMQFLLDNYGWKNCFLFVSCLKLQILILVAAYRPLPKIKASPSEKIALHEIRDSIEIIHEEANEKTAVVIQNDCQNTNTQENQSRCSRILSAIEQHTRSHRQILKNIDFFSLCLATVLFNIAFGPYTTGFVPIAVDKGINPQAAALIPPAYCLGNFLMQIVTGIIASAPCTNRLLLFAFALLVGSVVLFTLSLGETLTHFIIFASIYGVTQGVVGPLQPTILVDLFGREILPTSLGLYLLSIGAGNVIGVPLSGYLRDLTGEFKASHYVGGTMHVLAAMIVLTVFLRNRNRKRSKP